MNTPTPPPPPPADAWFYADLDYQRQGPVGRDALIALYRQGRLRAESLVWREGMESWQPLSAMIELPPPDMASIQFGSGAPSGVAEKKKMSGCMIAGLVAGALAVVSIPVIAILAAIAIPAYQDYTVRAKVAMISAALDQYRPPIADRYAMDGHCLANGEDGIPAADGFGIAGVSSVEIGTLDDGPDTVQSCAISATLHDVGNAKLDGTTLRWEYLPAGDGQPNQWVCSSDADDRYLPERCRG